MNVCGLRWRNSRKRPIMKRREAVQRGRIRPVSYIIKLAAPARNLHYHCREPFSFLNIINVFGASAAANISRTLFRQKAARAERKKAFWLAYGKMSAKSSVASAERKLIAMTVISIIRLHQRPSRPSDALWERGERRRRVCQSPFIGEFKKRSGIRRRYRRQPLSNNSASISVEASSSSPVWGARAAAPCRNQRRRRTLFDASRNADDLTRRARNGGK